MNKNILILLFAACSFGVTGPARAQLASMTNQAVMETIVPDARAAGMADIGSATAPDVFAQHWNVAKYAFAVDTGAVGLSYTPWIGATNSYASHLAYVAGYYRFGAHAVSASIRYMTDGELDFRNADATVYGTSSPAQFSIDAGYSHAFGKYFSVGAAFRYLSLPQFVGIGDERYNDGRTGTVAADVGLYFRYPSVAGNEFALALSVKNMGGKIEFSPGTKQFLPMMMYLGSRYTARFAGHHGLAFAVEISKPLVPEDQTKSLFNGLFNSFGNNIKEWGASLGAEYSYTDHAFLRAGYHFGSAEMYAAGSYVSAGAGIQWWRLALALSYQLNTSGMTSTSNIVRASLQYTF
ncbi:MAG: PorV/PorQ family protein [Prevotellaceae bacterium]|jgi:hypothetical protein|nr:PorV/PorQ family protein [Prevotellaceae bacterium]